MLETTASTILRRDGVPSQFPSSSLISSILAPDRSSSCARITVTLSSNRKTSEYIDERSGGPLADDDDLEVTHLEGLTHDFDELSKKVDTYKGFKTWSQCVQDPCQGPCPEC